MARMGSASTGPEPRFYDDSGASVSGAGDFNGDGIDDLIIGAPNAGANYNSVGESYVIFGTSGGFASRIDLAALDGSNGVTFVGRTDNDYAGASVSGAGDVNGDGIDDVIIGAPGLSYSAYYAGGSFVVFGRATGFEARFELSSIDGANGFRIDGINDFDNVGNDVSGAGDVNGDGFDDVIVSSDEAAGSAGESYVIFGAANGFQTSIALSTLDGSSGFRIVGTDVGDGSGTSISGAGDVNGDDLDDLIIGAPGADPAGNDSGESYIIFGTSGGFPAVLDLSALDGTNGFPINGVDADDQSGFSVSGAGDVNGDGLDDLIIGALGGDEGGSSSGESYVVFGFAGDDPSPDALEVALIDADSDEVIQSLSNGDVLAEGALIGRNVTIAATVPEDGPLGGQVESIVLNLNDGQAVRKENFDPYALFGDNPNSGNFFAGPAGFELARGENTISFDLFAKNGGRDLIETVEFGFTVTPDPVTAIVDVDGVQRGRGPVDTAQSGPDTDLELGLRFTTGLLFENVLVADYAQVAGATLALTSERTQSGVDLDVEIGLFDGSEGVELARPSKLTSGFDFFSTDQLAGNFAEDEEIKLDVTSSVADFLADQEGANTDGTFDFLFSLTSADGIFRVNPEEAGDPLAAELIIEFV